MPVQRKVFRIEQMGSTAAPLPDAAAERPASAPAPAPGQQAEILAELKALRTLIERRPADSADIDPERAVAGLRQLKDETDAIHRAISRTKARNRVALRIAAFDGVGEARATRELDAVVDCAERATQQILAAAEDIEEAANTLSASLKQGQEQALAQDIQDHVIHIFEACNFQDLSGQRITKVLATLTFVEDHIARMMEIWGGIEAFKDYAAAANTKRDSNAKLVNGPKLDGDRGHVSQSDIDAMFATR